MHLTNTQLLTVPKEIASAQGHLINQAVVIVFQPVQALAGQSIQVNPHIAAAPTSPIALLPQSASQETASEEINSLTQKTTFGEKIAIIEEVTAKEDLQGNQSDEFLEASHELGKPLTNIKLAIRLLKAVKINGNTESQDRYLNILEQECQRCSDLFSELIDLQRLKSASLKLETIKLRYWLHQLTKPVQLRFEERKQHFQLNFRTNLPSLISNRSCLERILLELLNNACKYTAPDGSIHLNAYKGNSNKTEPSIIFEIANSAEIPEAHLPHIFEKFYRIPKGDRWQQGGTGLGLSMVQELTKKLGGSIEVKSSNSWTTFTIELPTISKVC